MKKFFTIFFISLGVIFFIILLVLAYLWFADPFEIRPLLERYQSSTTLGTKTIETEDGEAVTSLDEESHTETNQNTNLTPAQTKALSVVGIDPAAVPSTFTPLQIECFVGVLGQERVDEIKAGAVPTPTEFFSARECL